MGRNQCHARGKIWYVDVTSLYHTVNKYDKYPIGHPVIVTQLVQDIHCYFSIADCIVLPPKVLFYPVLPYRCHGKVTFPLCRACVKEDIRNG